MFTSYPQFTYEHIKLYTKLHHFSTLIWYCFLFPFIWFSTSFLFNTFFLLSTSWKGHNIFSLFLLLLIHLFYLLQTILLLPLVFMICFQSVGFLWLRYDKTASTAIFLLFLSQVMILPRERGWKRSNPNEHFLRLKTFFNSTWNEKVKLNNSLCFLFLTHT